MKLIPNRAKSWACNECFWTLISDVVGRLGFKAIGTSRGNFCKGCVDTIGQELMCQEWSNKLEKHIDPSCSGGEGGMTKEFQPTPVVEMPLENSIPIELCLHLRLHNNE